MRAALGLADLVRIAEHLPWSEVLALAQAQGFERSQRSPALPVISVAPGPAVEHEAPIAPATAGGTAAPVAMPFWYLTRVEHIAHHWGEAPRGEALRATDRHDPARSITHAPAGEPAEPWRWLGPTLQTLLDGRRPRRALDLPALVRVLGRARRLNPIPRQSRLLWPTRVHVWADRSDRLLPLWRDQSIICQQLRRLCGAAAVSAQAIHRARLATFEPLEGVHPGDVVLVLGDLGFLGDSSLRARWREIGEALEGQGARPVALVPVHGEASMAPWVRASWSRGTATPEATEALRVLASMAEVVQPGLLRAMRKVAGATLEDELAVWNHPSMLTGDACGLVMEASHLEGLRARFAELDEARRHTVAELVRAWHAHMPHELGAVETLVWHLKGGGAQVGDLGEALALLERLAVTLHDAAPEADIAWRQFAERACTRLPAGAFRDAAVKPVVERLQRAAAGGQAFELAGDAIPGQGQDGLLPGTRYAVRQVGEALHFAPCGEAWPSEPGPGSPVSWLEAAEPWVVIEQAGRRVWHPLGEPFMFDPEHGIELRSDRQVLLLERAEQPTWAKAVGRDRYGLWADLEIKGVRQRMRWIPGESLVESPKTERKLPLDPYREALAAALELRGFPVTKSPKEHETTLTEGYWLAETRVTQRLWRAVRGENGSAIKHPDWPVSPVSWDGIQRFLRRAGVAGLRLPTTMEWEFAAGRDTTDKHPQVSAAPAEFLARYLAVRELGYERSYLAGAFGPATEMPTNSFGLRGMSRPCWEWLFEHSPEGEKPQKKSALGPAPQRQGLSIPEELSLSFRDLEEPALMSVRFVHKPTDLRLAIGPAKLASGRGRVASRPTPPASRRFGRSSRR